MITHNDLHKIKKVLASDFEPFGQRIRESADCSCGCKYFVPLEGPLGSDWGICANSQSPRVGLLTFEHQGCPAFSN